MLQALSKAGDEAVNLLLWSIPSSDKNQKNKQEIYR